ncbi:MAG: hypothetical protein IJ043_08260 [Clostridia bacterium]|nr:hypothetical protein [Clostridia bacterium]
MPRQWIAAHPEDAVKTADGNLREALGSPAFRQDGAALLQLQEEPTSDDLRRFCTDAGAWCYCESGDVVYQGRGYLCIHAATAGEKTVRTPQKTFTLPMEQHETIMIKL